MTSAPHIELDRFGGSIADVRRHLQSATSALLGSTIAFTDDDWSQPSALPGWSRAHVASHLAGNAFGILRVLEGLADGAPVGLYRSRWDEQVAIQIGATRDSLSLQIDLDTSAGRLATAFREAPTDLAAVPVRLRPSVTMPAGMLPLARFSEVVLHHWDLLHGWDPSEIEIEPMLWLLEYNARLLVGDTRYPATRLIAVEGLDVTFGRPGAPQLVRGEAHTLFGWLVGRSLAPVGAAWGQLPIR